MSAPKFEIKGGWLRIDGHRMRMSLINEYAMNQEGWIVIWKPDAFEAMHFSHAGLADALDAWFDREGEVDRIRREMVWFDTEGNPRVNRS